MFNKTLYLIIFIILISISFGVYLHEEDIDDSAFIIALGIDTGKTNNLNLTLQISIPSDNNSSKSASSSNTENKSDTLIKNIECDSLNSGLNSANNLVSKKLNLSHCKLIIFSEEIAGYGISDYINTLENNLELRSNCNIIVSECSAKDFIESAKPKLENTTAKLYEIIKTETKHTSSTSDTTLNTVYTSIEDTFGEAITILGKLVNSQSSDDSGESNKEIELTGLAVFKDDKFIGELSIPETLCYLITTNKLKEGIISIPSPFDSSKVVDVHLSKLYNTKNNVEINNSIPKIKSTIYLESTILSNSKDFNPQSKEDIITLQNAISEYIKEEVLKYYNKISKEYKSDISHFGKYAVHMFPTEDKWLEYNWLNKFENAEFDVTVNVSIHTSYFIS